MCTAFRDSDVQGRVVLGEGKCAASPSLVAGQPYHILVVSLAKGATVMKNMCLVVIDDAIRPVAQVVFPRLLDGSNTDDKHSAPTTAATAVTETAATKTKAAVSTAARTTSKRSSRTINNMHAVNKPARRSNSQPFNKCNIKGLLICNRCRGDHQW